LDWSFFLSTVLRVDSKPLTSLPDSYLFKQTVHTRQRKKHRIINDQSNTEKEKAFANVECLANEDGIDKIYITELVCDGWKWRGPYINASSFEEANDKAALSGRIRVFGYLMLGRSSLSTVRKKHIPKIR